MRQLIVTVTLLLSAFSIAGNAQIFPAVVATVKLTNQTAGIKKTTLFTPTADGMFRVNVYMVNIMVGGNVDSTWGTSIGWTDDNGPWQLRDVAQVLTTEHDNSVFYVSNPFTFWSKAGTPINYNVTLKSGPAPGSAYNVYITLEQTM
jgi:hypothetical protein